MNHVNIVAIFCVLGVLSLVVGIVIALVTWDERAYNAREIARLRAEVEHHRGRSVEQRGDDAAALTRTLQHTRVWVEPSAEHLARWAQRPGHDWNAR